MEFKKNQKSSIFYGARFSQLFMKLDIETVKFPVLSRFDGLINTLYVSWTYLPGHVAIFPRDLHISTRVLDLNISDLVIYHVTNLKMIEID